MNTETAPSKAPAALWWTGLVLSIVPAALLALGGVMNIVQPDFVLENTRKLGYADSVVLPLGIVVIVTCALYLIPKTAVLGAIILTGYLGGAVEVHVRQGDPVPMLLMPVICAALLWGGLVLRDARLRSLLPWRRD